MPDTNLPAGKKGKIENLEESRSKLYLNIMKAILKMVLPVAAFALASAGAVSTTGSSTPADGTVLINGWVHNPDANNCSERLNLNCRTTSGTPVCMSSDAKQVFIKNGAGQCSVQLYRVPTP